MKSLFNLRNFHETLVVVRLAVNATGRGIVMGTALDTLTIICKWNSAGEKNENKEIKYEKIRDK